MLRHCFEWLQHCSNIATLCCAENRRCKSSRVTSPLSNDDDNDNVNKQLVLWENNSSTLASCFLVHFLDVYCLTTTWNLLMHHFMEDVNIRRRIFPFLNLDKVLKILTPGEIAYIWQFERIQIDAIKFKTMQICFFSDVFTAAVVIALPDLIIRGA